MENLGSWGLEETALPSPSPTSPPEGVQAPGDLTGSRPACPPPSPWPVGTGPAVLTTGPGHWEP